MTDTNDDNNPIEEKQQDSNSPDIPIEGAQPEPVESGAVSQEPLQEPVSSETPAAEVQKEADTADTAGEEVHQDSNASGASQEESPEKREVINVEVVGIRFRSCGKIYTFDANNIDLVPGNRVVVDSEMGLSMGYIVTPKHLREKTKESFKKVIRLASEKDFETIESNRALQDEAKAFCVEKSKELNLQMKVVTTEITLDKKRLIFYFTADGRIDFRELVRDLAAKFKTRIEMRQIGVRDEVKMLGGIGACGRQTCCNQFLTSFAPITIRMAKQQALSINQSKLSGICGRLMCCLGYEYYEGSDEEIVARDKVVKTDTPDKLEETVQEADSASISTERRQKPGTSTETKKQPRPQQKEQKDDTEEKQPEKKRPARGDRRRRRRRRGGKTSQDNSGQVKQEARQPETQKPAETGEKKTTGRPGSKRKRFWKKKKKKEE